ncbi:MAG: cysteine desulfurase family protein [Bacteroidota bacterium]
MKKIYLDYASSTPLDPEVFEEMLPYFANKTGNASSVHRFGQELKVVIEECRESIAHTINAESAEIVFVSGGTESDNFALKGMMKFLRAKNKTHVITSSIEHQAVLETCDYLSNNDFQISHLIPEKDGTISVASVQNLIRNETGMISLMHVNNELGTINPIEEIGAIAAKNNILFHTDAVQSFGKIPIDVKKINIDLLSASAHKIYGPKGIGILYIRNGTEIESLIHGGGQERGRRAGTESVPLIKGFASALQKIVHNSPLEFSRNNFLKKILIAKLSENFSSSASGISFTINGNLENAIPNILNISFVSPDFEIDGEMVLLNLDLEGIAVSSGSACTSGSLKPSHVLLALGCDEKTANASIRFSFGRRTTEEEIDYTAKTLFEIVKRIAHKIKKA